MDALLGRHKKSSRIITLNKLAISRIAILKNQKQVRSSVARSDVIQLLQLGHQDRALLRAELVIKEQNMFDALSMIEGYCKILSESIRVLEKNQMEVSDDLKEAIASLMFAAPRCGEFPELREICRIIWKEFTASAVQIHNDKYSSSVNTKIIRKLTLARQPSSGSRLMALKEIASENGIQLLQLSELNGQDTEFENKLDTEMMNHDLCESPREENEDERDAAEELLTDGTAAAAAFGSSRSDLEESDHDNNGSNDLIDEETKVNSELPNQGDSLGSNRRHLTRQNGCVVERKHRNNNYIATQESNHVRSYKGGAVGSDLLNWNIDVVAVYH